ncbi:hypothetical protein ACVWYH_004061 [Bradyrhizobium sp. GM24.11]
MTEPLARWNVIVRVVKVYPQAMDDAGCARLPCRDRADTLARHSAGRTMETIAMNTSRRILLAGMAGLAVAPAAMAVAPAPAMADATVAEERFARMIAAAHAPDVACARQAERYADAHWPDYIVAARAVLDARV